MALSTPISLTQRGIAANSGVTTALYQHAQVAAISPVTVAHAVFHGPDATVVKGAAIATSDVFQLVSIPAGSFVLSVAAKVITAEGATCTLDIGDGATADGYFDDLNGNTTTDTNSFDGTTTDAFMSGKYYASADTIDVKLASGTAATVVLAVSVAYISMKQQVVV
jgi:hypothetical protein